MEDSTLYRVLEMSVLPEWRDKIEKEENYYRLRAEKLAEEIAEIVSEKAGQLLRTYALAMEDHLDFLHRNLAIKCLHLGVQIGLELQKPIVEE